MCSNLTCVEPGCNAGNYNIDGEVLLLDVNSWQYQGGPNHPPKITTAQGCCQVQVLPVV